MTQEIVTANRLRDGAVVYLAPEGYWSERLADAVVVEGEAAAAELLGTADTAVKAQIVVAPYRADVTLESGLPVPRTTKERIRSRGPSIHPELGKQAEGQPA
ncbi:MAG: DUF2849 domain-containing protein [Dongiaceae bacterium]